MENKLKKGIFYGILGTFFIGLQPIIANSRPAILDAHIFAAITCLVEATLFFPIMIIELKRTFVGYGLAGSINGSLTQKTTVFFSLIFGSMILKEKISKLQIVFSIILFIGLIIAITEGTFFIIFNIKFDVLIGVLTLLFIACLWMFGHTLTKPMFSKNEATPTQIVFVRNILSGIILLGTYFLYNPLTKLQLLYNPVNLFYFIAMGVVYGTGLYCWYKTLSILDVSKATIMVSPTPIVTSIFATFLLGEVFTIFHFIGTGLIIVSIVMIMKEKDEK
ncbi:MAG: DMT family transporter [Candidatus Lokiarchaeota archaeon]